METHEAFRSANELFMWLVEPENNQSYYYRGICKPEQSYPTIMRTLEGDLSFCEDIILHDFMRYGNSLVGNMSNAFDCVACAQHFGLPTRLVDWSRNPLVALFFAIYYATEDTKPQLLLLPREKTMPVYEPVHKVSYAEMGISYRNPIRDYRKFIKQVGEGLFPDLCINLLKYLDDTSDELAESYSKKIRKNDSKGLMIMVDPGYSNSRILAQDGLFYLPRKLTKESINSEYKASEIETIDINPSWRLSILNMLDNSGISKYKLFFDLPTICSYIVERAKNSVDQALDQAEMGFYYADMAED